MTPKNPTTEESAGLKFKDLWVGDRFRCGESLWTCLDHRTARRHCDEGTALAERGYGYIGDAICSFEPDDAVEFVPVNQRAAVPSSEFSVYELQDIADALSVAMTDIQQHLQVAKYNLRGEINGGDVIEKPSPPLLVHECGIAASERIIERCRGVWRKVWERIKNEPNAQPEQP